MNDQPAPLYYGDVRLDTLADAIEDKVYEMIYERIRDQKIPAILVLGILDRVKMRFHDVLDQEP